MKPTVNFAGRDLYQYYGLMDRLKAAGRQIFERNGSRLGDFFNTLVTFVDRRDKEAAAYNCVPWGINYLISMSECARDTFYRYFNVLVELGIIKTERGPNFKDRVVVYLPFIDKNLNVDASVFNNITEERINEFIARRNGEVLPTPTASDMAVDNSSPVVQITDIQTTDTKSLKYLNNTITITTEQNFLDELKIYAAGVAASRQGGSSDDEIKYTELRGHGGNVDTEPSVRIAGHYPEEPMHVLQERANTGSAKSNEEAGTTDHCLGSSSIGTGSDTEVMGATSEQENQPATTIPCGVAGKRELAHSDCLNAFVLDVIAHKIKMLSIIKSKCAPFCK